MTERECPHCATIVEEGAATCSFCGEDVAPAGQEPPDDIEAPPDDIVGEAVAVEWRFVKLRATPRASGRVLARLPEGTPLEIISERYEYVRVRQPGSDLNGWVVGASLGPRDDTAKETPKTITETKSTGMRHCRFCGEQLGGKARYCAACGRRTSVESISTQKAPIVSGSIEEEERIRAEVRIRAEEEARRKIEAEKIQKGFLGCLGIIVVLVILSIVGGLLPKSDSGSKTVGGSGGQEIVDIDPRAQCNKIMKGESESDISYQPIYGPCCKDPVAMASKEAMERCIGYRAVDELRKRGVDVGD